MHAEIYSLLQTAHANVKKLVWQQIMTESHSLIRRPGAGTIPLSVQFVETEKWEIQMGTLLVPRDNLLNAKNFMIRVGVLLLRVRVIEYNPLRVFHAIVVVNPK